MARGQDTSNNPERRVDRPTLAVKKIRPILSLTSNQDDAPPMGMTRPQIPDHLKAPVYNEPDPAGEIKLPSWLAKARQQGK